MFTLFVLLIQESAEEKEFCEKTYKREALDLRRIVDEREKEIRDLKLSLSQAQSVRKSFRYCFDAYKSKFIILQQYRHSEVFLILWCPWFSIFSYR